MRVISVHEYELADGVNEKDFFAAVRAAEQRGLLDLPGLLGHHFVRGLKGNRKDKLAAVWIYESRGAWEQLWGPPESPKPKYEYPVQWQQFEDDVLTPLLDRDADAIAFTAYEEL